jgi:hypothetical protein
VLTLGLSAVALALFLYKAAVLRFPLLPEAQAYLWTVEAGITFVARNKPVKVWLYIPHDSRHFAIMDENFISKGYGLTTAHEPEYANREAIWSIRRAKGQQRLYYRGVVRRSEMKEPPTPRKRPLIGPPSLESPYLEAAESLIAEIQARSADTDSFVANLVRHVNDPQPDHDVALLLGTQASASKKMEVTVLVLAQAGIAARVVHGIRLEEQNRNAPIEEWLEVNDEGLWRCYDPSSGEAGVPDDYLPWWRGPEPLARSKGGDDLQVRLAVSLNQEAAIGSAIERGKIINPLLVDFSLFSLPIQTQAVYRVLLLVPVGAFLVVVFRNIIGLNTFGTFMPVLIALAFRETELLWGILLFSIVVAFGLGIRFYLERLKLLLVPRLASVLIVVVLLMAALSVLTHRLGLERGLSVALFPMVILTMTIERMSVVWEERGAGEALQQAVGSLVVATLAYLIMTVTYVEHLAFFFPELLLVLLAGTLLIGRYTGYRLVELRRFKALVKEGP